MNNTDILELKKRYKKDNSITRIQGCYVLGMEKKIQTLRDNTCRFPDVSFAIGCAAAEPGEVQQALKDADERMYADKKRYYGQRENDRRK